jgi:hypothetical protein
MSLDSFERFLELLNSRSPYRSYLIELASGDRLEVRHPEAIARTGDCFYLRAPDREQRVFEPDAVVQLIVRAPGQKSG